MVWGLLLRDRNFPAWTPEGRVLEALRTHALQAEPEVLCQLKCNELEMNDVLNVINTADVKFGESNIRGKEVPEYLLEGQSLNGKTYQMIFSQKGNYSYLHKVLPVKDGRDCECP